MLLYDLHPHSRLSRMQPHLRAWHSRSSIAQCVLRSLPAQYMQCCSAQRCYPIRICRITPINPMSSTGSPGGSRPLTTWASPSTRVLTCPPLRLLAYPFMYCSSYQKMLFVLVPRSLQDSDEGSIVMTMAENKLCNDMLQAG